MKHIFSLALLSIVFSLSSQTTFKLEEIMKGPDFAGYSPENIHWSCDSKQVYFDWNKNLETGTSPYKLVIGKSTPEPIPFGPPAVPDAPVGQQITGQYYFSQLGNLARYTSASVPVTTVVSLEDEIGNVQRVLNPAHVYFRLHDNLYCYDEKTGGIRQVTRFIQGAAPTEKDSSALMRQQNELFDYIRKEQVKKQWQKDHKTERDLPLVCYYGKEEHPEDLMISPNERFITFRLSIYPEDPATYIEEFITPNGFTNRVPARAKVGNNDPSHRMGIYDAVSDTVIYVSFAALSDIRKKPAYLDDYGTGDGLYEKDRAIIMHAPVMHPDGNSALVDIRSYDNKDRWIILLDLKTGKFRELDHQHDEAWIGGPGISGWNAETGTLGWTDAYSCYYQSEASGYSHLYLQHTVTGQKTALTSGNWEVYDVIFSKNKQTFFLLTNTLHPGVRNGYQLKLSDKKLVPLFTGNFGIEWSLSPDEKNWAIRYSTSTQPWELYVAENKPGAVMKRITYSTTPAYDQLPVKAPEIVQIPTSDGLSVTARLYRPKNANGAAVLFVHGAGYLQNAHHYWSHYHREFLFHQLLMEKGYTVLDIDYRASEGYGRDVRTAIYRHMGERDLLDYVDGKNYLVRQFGIDSNRVGIYGGSYGGFITLMGMLKTPGTFACGAALRSVTDWEHYNHEYTSNILNYPGTDPEAYRKSSPIYYANGLNGPLLMLHGMEDDNVQFQDIVRLNQRFIELGKTNYQLAVFPTEAHGFQYTPAWIDEYRRILELFETHLK